MSVPKIYRELSMEFTKALNKMGFTGPKRAFVTYSSSEKVMETLFSEIFKMLDEGKSVNIRHFCILKKIKCHDGKYYIECKDIRK